ncbi:MAG: amidohydrolase family protein [Acidimicrobiales bacterium]|nr:MAG: amidohydrolase [marine actinobacterium MedAcidi-G1]HAQ05084.1 amidohydrolase [Acidimicrobiaceae bacterium]|tara:strand:- start:25564 stop:26928 length:1365 start_codon:yes stop_codon:yes gene_type:complete
MHSILLEGPAIVTVDDSNSVLDPGWIFTKNDVIENIGKGEAPRNIRKEADEIIETPGSAVMPGMVNGHTHLFQTFFRGLADDKPLLDWLKECIWPGASELDAESAKAAATLGLIENLRGGATTVVDHQYIHVDPQIDHAVCQAASEAGLRFILASGWADRNYHPPLTESAKEVVSRIRSVHEKWHGAENNRIQVGLAPLIPWGCSDSAMTETVTATRSWGGSTHLHCAETAIEVEMNIEERGLRHVHWLESLGLLGPDIQLAHSIWLDEDEIDLISKRGASVVHCPVSNMYLASGVAKIKEMLDRGITVALATDGPGSNNRQDMFETCKATVLLQKVDRLDASVLQPEEVLHLACRHGARLVGKEKEIGSLEIGKKADLIVIDLMTAFSAPVHKVASAIVYCATPRDVTHVMVDGKFLIKDRDITFTNEKKAIARATKCAEKVFQKANIPSRLL